MALVEHWRTDFDTDAKVAKFFYSPAPGGLANDASLRRVVTADDAVSCIEINIGNEVPDVEYFRTFSGANQDAYDKMVADLPNRTVGQKLYAYSTDSTKHGSYTVLPGLVLSARTGSVAPKIADDENHRRVVQIGLLLRGWSAAGDGYSSGSLQGFPSFAALNASIGRPANHDLSGWVMRWRMRAQNMSMGRRTKLAQLLQTRIPGMPRIGTYSDAGAPFGAPAYVNAINTATCISDELGFGDGGLFAANTVDFVADSAWVDVDIELEALWSYWHHIGGNADKMGSEGAAYDKSLRYVVANPAVWATNWTGNASVLQAKFNTDPDTDLAVVPNNEAVKGRLLVSSLSFLRAA